jgi:small-conductance mechanosensitive channel
MALGGIEAGLLGVAAALIMIGSLKRFRAYRSLLWGSGMLSLITALIPRPGNGIGQYLFAPTQPGPHLPVELFGLAWWVLGAWLVKSVLDLILEKTIFPNDNQPHARRLFADLASALVYVIAFVGIIETVLKQPISAVLATSGVLAIVLGLALQNTLADVFSGLAINIEHPFRAGDWITLNGDVEGEVMEINWRATRLRSGANDLIMIPNSVIAKAIVTNHRRLSSPHVVTIGIEIDHRVPTTRVIDVLQTAATGSGGIAPNSAPVAYAIGFSDNLISYQLCFGIDDFTLSPGVRSEVIGRVTDALRNRGIAAGRSPIEVHIVPLATAPAPAALQKIAAKGVAAG